jgi:ABC-2 type transport system permease protein
MIAALRREFTRNRTSFYIYCVISIGFALMYIALFPSIQKQSQQIDQIMKSLPDSISQAFGIDKTGFSSIDKYLTTELMSLIWPLLMFLICISRAGSSIAGAIENKTLGLELALPETRLRLFLSKVFGGMIPIALFSFVSTFCILPLCWAYSIHIDFAHVFMLFLICLLVAATVHSFAIAVSASTSDKGHVYFIVGGVVLGSYVANIVAHLTHTFIWLKHISLFNFFIPRDALANGTIHSTSLVFFAVVIIVSLTLGFIQFRQRDIMV